MITMYALYRNGQPILLKQSPYESTASGIVPLFFEMGDALEAKKAEEQKDPSTKVMIKEVKLPAR